MRPEFATNLITGNTALNKGNPSGVKGKRFLDEERHALVLIICQG